MKDIQDGDRPVPYVGANTGMKGEAVANVRPVLTVRQTANYCDFAVQDLSPAKVRQTSARMSVDHR